MRQLQSVLFRAAVYCENDTLTAESFPQLSEMIGELEANDVRWVILLENVPGDPAFRARAYRGAGRWWHAYRPRRGCGGIARR